MIKEIGPQYAIPVFLSLSIALGAQFVSNSTDSAFLRQNIEVTRQLSDTLKQLEISLSVFQERYPTRTEVEQRIKEAINGT